MRVLLYGINYSPELTGIGKYNGEMATWLSDQGHEVRVITAPPYYPDWKIAAPYSGWRYQCESLSGVTVWRCPLWVPKKPSGLTRILHLASFALSSMPVLLRQWTWRPDLVVTIEPPLLCSPAALLFSRFAGSKAWLHIQDFEVDAAFQLGLLRSPRLQKLILQAEKWLLHRFDRVSTISHAMMARLKAKGVEELVPVLFPNWADIGCIYPDQIGGKRLKVELGLPEACKIALYSGNMGEKQGLDVLVEAAEILAHREDILFILCGTGAAKPRLEKQAKPLPNVMFLPLQPLETFNDLLNLADIHLLPQRADAADLVMPSKLTGILACGGAVVATAAPDTEVDRVVREAGGSVCLPGDATSLSVRIQELIDDEAHRSKVGQKAREYAEQHLSRHDILSVFERIAFDLLDPPIQTGLQSSDCKD